MFRQMAVEQRWHAAGMADTQVDRLKLPKLHQNWECAQVRKKTFIFYNVAAACRTTEGTEEVRACVSRYNQSAWTVK